MALAAGTARHTTEVYDLEVDDLDMLWDLFCNPKSPYHNGQVKVVVQNPPGACWIAFSSMGRHDARSLCELALAQASLDTDETRFGHADYRRALRAIVDALA